VKSFTKWLSITLLFVAMMWLVGRANRSVPQDTDSCGCGVSFKSQAAPSKVSTDCKPAPSARHRAKPEAENANRDSSE
jgi:hypothetical protein